MRYQEFAESSMCPECGGPAFSDLMLAEKQDACYHKVKSRYKVWPSAYASGALVQCRKKGAANWGNKSKNESMMNEFAPSNDNGDNEPDEYEILHRLAAMWWLGTEQQMIKAQRTLASMGWEIGEDEGYDDGGVFVVRANDEHGKSYISWPHEDLQLNEQGVVESGNPQMVARRISVPRVSTVDTSAPWVQNQIQQARRRKKEFNELETGREKFDFLFKLKSGKTTNTIKIRKDNSTLNLNIEKYNPGTGDIELVGYSTSAGRKGSVEQRYRANTNTFDYQGRERKGLTGGFNYYFSPGTSLELLSSQPRVKTQAPAPAVSKKPASPWDILDKKK